MEKSNIPVGKLQLSSPHVAQLCRILHGICVHLGKITRVFILSIFHEAVESSYVSGYQLALRHVLSEGEHRIYS